MKKLVLHYQRQQADDEPKGGDSIHSTLALADNYQVGR